MLDFEEYDFLLKGFQLESKKYRPSSVIYSCEMLRNDLRFSEYEWYIINYNPETIKDEIDLITLKELDYNISYFYSSNLENRFKQKLIEYGFIFK